ncbi:uncharacterized protein [Apostichopus japonicus]|uniref:uncharacterized protein isoform X1 n=1 Tax=Stichopus japonicus TaxID=307972 RepID=UPI003AB16C88
MDNSVSIVLLVLLLVHSSKPAIFERVDGYSCKSPQLLELGKIGSVQCLFTNNFNEVHWFNSTNVVDDKPIISLQGSRKDGSGYLTREYDIRKDGSLIIHNVSLQHELTFAVVVLTPPDDTLIAIEVQVQVIVKPAVLFPVISTCSRGERICFAKLHLINSFTCSMGNSRPPVSVTLKVRTLYGDRSITGPYENKTMIAFSPQNIDTDDIWMSSSLVLLVCQVESNPFINMLKHQTSLILLQNNAVYLKDSPIVTVVFNKDGQLLLECDYYEGGVIVWERSSSAEGSYKISLYGSTGVEEFRIVLANDGISESNGSLVVSSANFQHEGFYRCISSNVIFETSRLYDAICIVSPSPPYPVIEGCNGIHTGCVLYFDDNHGIVECSIHRIYPKVDLAISLTSEDNSDLITFYDKEGKITEHEETFTVTLKYTVSVETTSTDQLTLQCTILDPPYEQLDLTTSFEIHLSRAVKRNEVDDVKKEDNRRKWALLCLPVVLIIAVVIVIGCVVKRIYSKKQCKTNAQPIARSPEETPLTDIDSGEQAVAGDTSRLSPNETETDIDSGEQARAGDTTRLSPNITEPTDQPSSNGIVSLGKYILQL